MSTAGKDLIGTMVDLQALFNVRGLTAVITGGSGQLGRAMASALAQAGVQVAIVSLHLLDVAAHLCGQ